MGRKRPLAAYDCETDPFVHGRVPRPFVWGIYTKKEGFRYFWGKHATQNFAAYLKEQRVCAYAHNGGKFDTYFLDSEFEAETPVLMIGSRIAKMQFGRAELRDSWCLAPLPLRKLGAKLEIDYALLEEENREAHKDEILAYLEADCIELYKYLEHFEGMHGRNLTIASAAMKHWRNLTKDDREVPMTTERYYQRIKPWYSGGRVQVFRSGISRGNYQLVDINSAYPRAMLEFHPYGGRYYLDEPILHPFEDDTRRFYRLRARHEGALWERTQGNGLSFRAGEGVYHATDWEVQAGLETGTLDVDEVLECVTHEDVAEFSLYVNEWYEKKKNAKNEISRVIAKLFLNSLYGKFGANPGKYREHVLDEIGYSFIEAPGGAYMPGCEINELQVYYRPLPEVKRRYYDVGTAASITGWVRAYLWKAIHASEEVLYCDTDSIIGKGFDRLSLGSGIGQWDVEVDGVGEAHIGGRKLYALFDHEGRCVKQACKGVRLSPEEITRIARGETVEHASDSPTFSLGRTTFQVRKVRMT